MSFESRAFRDALGRFPTGIAVITANPEGENPFGMTVNSFAAVSLDPPLVLWSIQKDSECYPSFKKASHYGVNFLASDQQDISNAYSKKGDHDLAEGCFRQGKSGCVVLKNAMVSFECELETIYEGGDHDILIGRVVEMDNSPKGESPLVFHGGKYRELR